jgi:predicted Zn-dependent protease
MLTSEKDCRKIAERALSFAPVEDASVSLTLTQGSNTRFANNEVTTSGAAESVALVLIAVKEGRSGRVTINETTDAALERGMKRAVELASVVPPDPEYVGALPPQKYLPVTAFDEATRKLGAGERLPGVRAVIEPAGQEKMNSSGFFTNGATFQCIANKAGNFGYFRSSNCSFSATVRTADGTGSGWAEDASWRASEVDAPALAGRALQKARDSKQPQVIEPGDYTVILEPAAVSGIMGFNFNAALSARLIEEGRSYFSKQGGGTRLGEKVFSESVTLKSDPTDARRPAAPWGGGGGGGGGGLFGLGGADVGIAGRPITWIRNGVLENLWFDRYWAKKAEREPTPSPTGLILEGGKETLESLIASTERGLLVTNFWYIRVVNAQSMQLTGLTRDGIWLIEKGKIAKPVMNLRFNESPAFMLSNVVGMTPAMRTGNSVVPAIKANAFTFSSLSDAV